ncbi:type I polyketide synthase [Streptomyces sp. GS7]|uniref:type I polyketide synthase n=1 Tax=Streptomyces sp. GS7 TaxID=2692234 RepID=UPI001318E2B0|nr:type I polyketide synthase [Streptomyces sp. GS7]QHC23520.1 SDR family NAD(P)-dependent oxidoreductase [Streptomyces sp. GS7]
MGAHDVRKSVAADAIAVVGVACRLPGGISDLGGLWDTLAGERDLITNGPPDGRFDTSRFFDPDPASPGKSYTFAGGYLHNLADFDAQYFGISPREAKRMDPQQRLLLEMAAEVFDDAGIAPQSLAGSDTAVFVGVSDTSYGVLQMLRYEDIDPHTMSGGSASIVANRLSHTFDLRGASMAVDTACSSSLVAVHQACEALRTGRSRVALAGGINVLLSPQPYVGFSRATMLSPHGRCAAFSARADGYVRAEGGGVVLLKRLADALADGDRVHAVIAASGTNTAGRTANLSVPSADVQRQLLLDVHARAGIGADDVVYFEAHGTGTPVGDPLECLAIGQAVATRRSCGALPIGSVKSNLGHSEPASGMAGLFKAMLVLRHGRIPATLHSTPANPAIDFRGLNLEPVTSMCPVARSGGFVGVNSFGFGGANAHVVLAEPPSRAAPSNRRQGALPLVISARSRPALAQTAREMAGFLAGGRHEEFYDLCWTLNRRRTRHPYRVAVLADGSLDAARQLSRLSGDDGELYESEAGAPRQGRVAFVFSGNGGQWHGMAADLMTSEPVFRAAVEEADVYLTPRLGWSVGELLTAGGRDSVQGSHVMSDTRYAQPALFAVQIGLSALLAHYGVRAHAVMGHSVGEVAAAYVCGALDLPTAARVIAERSLAQASTAGKGRMAAVALTPREAEKEIAPYAGLLEIAAVNSSRDVTISGDREALQQLGDDLATRGIPFRTLELDHAFHSAAMDGIEEPLRRALAGLVSAEPRLPMYSTVTAEPVRAGQLDAGYWWENVRRPVLFERAVRQLTGEGGPFDALVEIGPQPSLRGALTRIAAACDGGAFTVVPTLSRGPDSAEAVRRAVARLAAADAGMDWDRWFPTTGQVRDLPAYAWQRERHWFGTPEHWIRTSGDGILVHPLLGERAPVLEPTWQAKVERTRCPWLSDHRLDDGAVMPATAYLEMALAAGREVFGDAVELDCVDVTRLLPLPDGASGIQLQTSLSDEDGIFRVASRTSETAGWRLHARGRCRRLAGSAPRPLNAAQVRELTPRLVTGEEHYAAMGKRRLRYGPAFRVVRELRMGSGEVLASYHHGSRDDGGSYVTHPAILDVAFQAGVHLLPEGTDTYLPAAVGRVRVWRAPSPTGLVHVRERSRTHREFVCDITVTDDDGRVSVELERCRMHRSALHDDVPDEYITVLRAATPPGQRIPPVELPHPEAVLEEARPEISTILESWDEQRYARYTEALARSAAHSAAEAFAEILPGQDSFTLDDLVAAGVRSEYRSYAAMLARMACRQALLDGAGEHGWIRRAAGDFGRTVREGLRENPGYPALAALHGPGGLHLADVLRGRRDPSHTPLQEKGPARLRHIHDIEPVCALHDRIAAAVVRSLVRAAPGDRPLRVLEVGAGSGGLTACVLPLLPPERTEYVFSDATAACFPAAQARFGGYDFVRYRTFDVDRDPTEQGLTAGSFDLVVAGQALHAAQDVAACVRMLARLLAPGGNLLAVEAHDPELFALSTAMLPGFWQVQDRGLRAGSALPAYDQWRSVLAGNGFRVHEAAATPLPEQFSVVLARRDQDVAPGRSRHAEPSDAAGPVPWLVITEDDSEPALFAALVERLAMGTGGARTVTAKDVRAHRECLFDGTPAGIRIAYVLSEQEDLAVSGLPAAAVDLAVRRVATLRELARACQDGGEAVRSLCLVTHPTGSLPAPERPACPGQAAAWGAARTLANELTYLHVKRVSLERGAQPWDDARRLTDELQAVPGEEEVVLTRGGRFVPRVVRAPEAVVPSCGREGSGHRDCSLVVDDIGLGYRLQWDEAPAPRPEAGDVVVEVRAAALNYRDVMVVTGLLPPVAEDGVPSERLLGLECAGVVTAVGPGVDQLAVGDRVFGMVPGAFATSVRTRAAMVRKIPGHLSFTEAATMPTVFLTVQHSLDLLARLRAGETVLVHGGAGGVGLAALQYAQRIGATVIATAGTPAKRDLLHLLGADHVLDSRGLDFADRIRTLTGGRGVDVVLNSLSGEAMARSMEVLAPGGRFVELGKQDVYANHRVLLRPLAGNTALFVVDVAEMTAARTEYASEVLDTVLEHVGNGEYRPLPHQVFPAHRIADAFRLMQRSRHIGKVVVSLDGPVPVRPARVRPRMDEEGTYLVTGGLSGLGAVTAEWLAARGARRLALVGRRGAGTPGAAALLSRLAALGATAQAYAVDVTDAEAMRALVRSIDSGGHPLRGVIHAAMHLEDEKLTALEDGRIRAVLAPKLGGGLVLDDLTRGRDTGFLMYSSVSAMVGNVKQVAYSAGNLFLEALARQRLQDREPALCVAWGAIAETGYAARNGLNEVLAKGGLRSVTPGEVGAALDRFHVRGADVVAFGRCDWARLAMTASPLNARRLVHLVPPPAESADRCQEDLRAWLDSSPGKAVDRLEEVIASATADVLQMPVDSLDRVRPLQEYGLDSLMHMELLVELRRRSGCELAVMDLLHSDGSVRGISTVLLPRMTASLTDRSPGPPHPRG